MNHKSPQEIVDFRTKWMASGNNNPVTVPFDKVDEVVARCEHVLEPGYWHYVKYSDVSDATFWFYDKHAAEAVKYVFNL